MRGEPFTGSLFKGSKDQPTRLSESTADDRKAARAWLDLCRYVDLRDGRKCRACKRRVIATLAHVTERAEHHHVIPRSLGGKDTKSNVILTCLACHSKIHVTRELHVSGDAEEKVMFSTHERSWHG